MDYKNVRDVCEGFGARLRPVWKYPLSTLSITTLLCYFLFGPIGALLQQFQLNDGSIHECEHDLGFTTTLHICFSVTLWSPFILFWMISNSEPRQVLYGSMATAVSRGRMFTLVGLCVYIGGVCGTILQVLAISKRPTSSVMLYLAETVPDLPCPINGSDVYKTDPNVHAYSESSHVRNNPFLISLTTTAVFVFISTRLLYCDFVVRTCSMCICSASDRSCASVDSPAALELKPEFSVSFPDPPPPTHHTFHDDATTATHSEVGECRSEQKWEPSSVGKIDEDEVDSKLSGSDDDEVQIEIAAQLGSVHTELPVDYASDSTS